jgi:hypothetical protein
MFRVTYEIVTPESAEHGDAEERGFIEPGEWRTPIEEAMRQPDDFTMTLREAMRLCDPQEDSGRWWSECDGRQDYQTGAYEIRSLHPPEGITAASYARVTRLLGIPHPDYRAQD